MTWPAESIEMREIESLKSYSRNSRTHSPEQVDAICRSIEEFGWTVPVLVDDDGTVIAGHGRLMAARKMGISAVPVMVASGWSDEKMRAYVIADNRLPELAGWDEAVLGEELKALDQAGYDVTVTGFDIGAFVANVAGGDAGERVAVSDLDNTFWANINGPMQIQADVIAVLKQFGDLQIKIGGA